MKVWKSKKIPPKHDVWTSEVRLKKADIIKIGKVKKLFRLLGEEYNANLP